MINAVSRVAGLALLLCFSAGPAPGQNPAVTTIYMALASFSPFPNPNTGTFDLLPSIHVGGWGVPGTQTADGARGFMLASLSQPIVGSNNTFDPSSGVVVDISFIGETGMQTSTEISMMIRATNDTLHFLDTSPSWNNNGRTGTARLSNPTGSFRNANGVLSYTLTCGQGCPMGNEKIIDGSFDGKISGTVQLILPTADAQLRFPNLFTTTFLSRVEGNIAASLGVKPQQQLDRPMSQSAGTPYFSLTPTIQPTAVTYSATATCPNLPTGCWLSAPSPSGTINAFAFASITANYSIGNLPSGVYPADFAVAITSGPTTPPVTQDSPTVLILADEPPLAVSEGAILFEALAGQGAAATQSHSVVISSQAGQSLSFTATASMISGGGWLSVSASSGTAAPTQSLTIIANPAGLPPGNYYGRVDIASSGASSSPQSVFITLAVAGNGTEPMLSTKGLVFVVPQNSGTVSKSMQITTYSPTAVPIVAGSEEDDDMAWYSIFYTAFSVSSNAPVTLTVTVNPANLTPGPYTGTVSVQNTNDSSTFQVSILMVVTLASGQCTPTQLLPVLTSLGPNFDVPSAMPVSLQAQVIDDCGTPLNSGVVQATPSPDYAGVVLSPAGGGLWAGTWMPHNTAGGPAAVVVNAQSATGLQGTVAVPGNLDANPSVPIINSGGIANAASIAPTIVAPGEFISIFGANLGPTTLAEAQPPYPTTLAGTQVLLGGQALPLEVVSTGQINALIPYETALNGTQQMVVQQGGAYSMPEDVIVAAAQPGVFTQLLTGQGPGVIVVVKADGTQFVNTTSRPASAGDALVIYCAGLGAVNPPVADGDGAPLTPLSRTVATVTVTIGGQPATVAFSGQTPGFPGLYQVNVTVPSGVPSGSSVPVVVTAGGFPSPPVTAAIQ